MIELRFYGCCHPCLFQLLVFPFLILLFILLYDITRKIYYKRQLQETEIEKNDKQNESKTGSFEEK